MQIKLKDVAKKSGYSITTVSRALAGYTDVNEKTRQHIAEVAASMGYQPNLLARQLRSQRTQTLGLIIPSADHSFSNEFFSEFMRGIGDAVATQRYDLLFSAQPPGDDEMEAYRRFVGGNRVDGMIVVRTRKQDARIAYLREQHQPFVVFGRCAPDEPSDFAFIDVDSQVGIRMVTQHFIELGHRNIGLILPPSEMAFTEYRHQGYREALERAGLPYRAEYVVMGDLLRSGGYRGTHTLLEREPTLTAIVACNDLMALGAMTAIHERGLQVGHDVAVSGYDDLPAAEYSFPGLTTVRQPIYDIGQRLVRMLIDIIAGEPADEKHLLLSNTLIVRGSSGSAKG